MSPQNHLHGLLPVFNWPWWQVLLLVLMADWAIVRILRHIEPHEMRRPDWITAKYGDLFLPFGITAGVESVKYLHSSGWYSQPWWNYLTLATGFFLIITLEVGLLYMKKGVYTTKQELAPSNLWHILVFSLLFYLAIVTFIPLVGTLSPAWIKLMAMFGYGGWGACVLYDYFHPNGVVRRHS